MHDVDDQLRILLAAAELVTPVGDHRAPIEARARRRQRRQRAVLAVPLVVGVLTVALAVGLSPTDGESPEVAARPSDTREVDVRGIQDAIRMSMTTHPLPETRSFGSIPLADGAITGATQTTLDDGTVVVLVAVTPGPHTSTVAIVGPGGEPVRAAVGAEAVLLTLLLDAWDPSVVIDVRALDDSEALLAAARVVPFSQSPLTCETNTEQVGEGTATADPTRIPHLDAFLGAPLPASCDG